MPEERKDAERIQTLLKSIIGLQRENRRLRKLLEDHGIIPPKISEAVSYTHLRAHET